MDGGRIGRRDPGEGDGGDALIGEGGGVAGIDILLAGDAEALLHAHIGQVMAQLLFAGDAVDELAHDAADHVQIDIQDAVLQGFLIGAVGLGAQQAPLLAAAPDEAQAVAVGVLCEELRDSQQTHGAGHIVIGTLGQGGGIIMSGEGDVLVGLAGHIQDHVMGLTGILLLLQDDLGGGSTLADKRDGRLGIDVHAGDLVALADEAAQLPLVDVEIAVVGVSVIGDEAHGTVLQQVLVHPVAHVSVHHDDLALALAQAVGIGGAEIIEGSLHLMGTGAEIALAGDLLSVDQKLRFLDGGHIHIEGTDLGLQPQFRHLSLQVLSSLQFLRAATHAHIGRLPEDLHDLICIHDKCLLFGFLYGIPIRRDLQVVFHRKRT